MGTPASEIVRIKEILETHRKGLTIAEIAQILKLNRVSTSKYLSMLLSSGDVEMRIHGPSKVFYPSQRVPISTVLNFSSNLILVTDDTLSVVSVNDALLSFFSLNKENLIGHRLDFSPLAGCFDDKIFRKIRSALDGTAGSQELTIILHEERHYLTVRFLPTVFESGGLSVTLIMEDRTSQTRCCNQYQAILDDPKIMIGRISPEGFLNFSNTAFCTFFSCDPDKITAIRFVSLFPKGYQKKIHAQYTILNKESRATTFEIEITSPEATPHKSRWTITALLDSENTIYEYLALGIDTTSP